MSMIQRQTEIVRGAVPLDPPAPTKGVRAGRPGAGRIAAALVLAAAGLLLGLIAGIVLVLATGLVAVC